MKKQTKKPSKSPAPSQVFKEPAKIKTKKKVVIQSTNAILVEQQRQVAKVLQD